MKFSALRSIVAGAAAGVLLLTGCAAGGDAGDGGGAGATLSIGNPSEITNWDPAEAHVGHGLVPYQAAYDTLIRRAPDGSYEPMLATEWTYDDTRTALTLTLRDDVTFSDGATFDAEAVRANLDHFADANGRQASQLAAYESTEVVDATTAVVHLTAPDPAFEYWLSQAAGLMGSPDALGTPEISAAPVGSGPYVFDATMSVTGDRYVFIARDDYWAPELQQFDTVSFRVLLDPTARLNALLSEQVDGTLLDATALEQAEASGREIVTNEANWTGLLLLDRDGATVPALADVRVRQAINYALDRPALLETIVRGSGTPTAQVFGPETTAFDGAYDSAYPYDPELARELLAEAGYADGFSMTVPSTPAFEPALVTVRQQLADVGIELVLQGIPAESLVSSIAGGDFPVAFFTLFQGAPWVAINQMISTNALYNPFDTTTPELQALIDAVQQAPADDSAPAAAVNDYVVDEAWFAPLYRPEQIYAINSSTISVEAQVEQGVPSIYNYSPAES